MEVVEQIADVRAAVTAARQGGERIRLVPTMGALHAGHLSLINAACRDGGCVVVSIFVNPTQFGPHEDLQRYPRPKDLDLAACRQAGANLVFHPAVAEMYTAAATTFVDVGVLSTIWEGAIRPGHFRGVATVVAKLFNIIGPDDAYFGQKDYQQQVVIRRMVRDLNLPVEIHTCPTVRDADGIALSSRNAYLSPEQRIAGLSLSRALQRGEEDLRRGMNDPRHLSARMQELIGGTPGATLDYAVVVDPESLQELDRTQPVMVALVAGRFGSTRLIDNAVWR